MITPRGRDLVIEATNVGFEQFIVVKNSSALDQVAQVRLALTGPAVAAHATDGSGGIELKDADGAVLAHLPAPKMWDAAVDDNGARTSERGIGVATAKRAAVKGVRTKAAGFAADQGLAKAAGVAITMTPDAAWLRDTARAFPITIDPSVSTYYSGADTYVVQGSTTDHSTDADLQIGLNSGSVRRTLIKWPVPWAVGAHVYVKTATAYLYNFNSGACARANWQMWRMTGVWGTTWATMPYWDRLESTSTATKGYSSSCADGDDGYIAISATYFFQHASDNDETTPIMGLKAESETTVNSFKQFRPHGYSPATMQPYIDMTYYQLSNVLAMSTTPATTCDQFHPRKIGSKTPTLQAQVYNPSGGAMYGTFQIEDVTDAVIMPEATSTQVTSGQTASYTVPAGLLAEGQRYWWKARAFDLHMWSGDGRLPQSWSEECGIIIDTIAPASPTVSSADYPAGLWSKAAGATGTFTLNGSVSSDVVGFDYSIDGQAQPSVTADAVQQATITATPATDGPHSLVVSSYDGAGNRSQPVTYQFYAGKAGFITPVMGAVSAAQVQVAPIGSPQITSMSALQWRRGDADTWQTVPVADLAYTNGGSAVGGWPLNSTGGGAFASMNWNLAQTLNNAETGAEPVDGPVQVRGMFTMAGGQSAPSATVDITFDRDMGTAATAAIGPGEVNLLTGNLSITAADASASGLSVVRTLNTREAGAVDGTGMFGPGWISGFDKLDTAGTVTEVGGGGSRLRSFVRSDVTATSETYVTQDTAPGITTTLVHYQSPDRYVMTDKVGTASETTTYNPVGGGEYLPSTTTNSVTSSKVVYDWATATVDGQTVHRPSEIRYQADSAVACTASTKQAGCHALTFTYATTSTATGTAEATWGAWTGRLARVDYTAYDPSASMATIAMAGYAYDNTGRLRMAWDPRLDYGLGSHQAIRYTYNSDGTLQQVKPAAEEAWTISYTTIPGDSGKGRVRAVSQTVPTLGTATSTLVYRVPTSGATSPYEIPPIAWRPDLRG